MLSKQPFAVSQTDTALNTHYPMDEPSLPNQDENLWLARMSRMDSMISATMMKRQVLLANEPQVVFSATDESMAGESVEEDFQETDTVFAEESAGLEMHANEAGSEFHFPQSLVSLDADGDLGLDESWSEVGTDLENIPVRRQEERLEADKALRMGAALAVRSSSRSRGSIVDENPGYPLRQQEMERGFEAPVGRLGKDFGGVSAANEDMESLEMPVRRRNIDAEPTPLELFNAMSRRRDAVRFFEEGEDFASVVASRDTASVETVAVVIPVSVGMIGSGREEGSQRDREEMRSVISDKQPLAIRTGASDRDAVARLLSSLSQSRGAAQEKTAQSGGGMVLSTDYWAGMDAFTVDGDQADSMDGDLIEVEPRSTDVFVKETDGLQTEIGEVAGRFMRGLFGGQILPQREAVGIMQWAKTPQAEPEPEESEEEVDLPPSMADAVEGLLDSQAVEEPEKKLTVDLEFRVPEVGRRDTMRRLLDDFRQQRQVMMFEGGMAEPGLILGAVSSPLPLSCELAEDDVQHGGEIEETASSVDALENDWVDDVVQEVVVDDAGEEFTDAGAQEMGNVELEDDSVDGVEEELLVEEAESDSGYEVVEAVLVEYLEQALEADEVTEGVVETQEDESALDVAAECLAQGEGGNEASALGEEEVLMLVEEWKKRYENEVTDGGDERLEEDSSKVLSEVVDRSVLDGMEAVQREMASEPSAMESLDSVEPPKKVSGGTLKENPKVKSLPKTFQVNVDDYETFDGDLSPIKFTRPPKAFAQVRVFDEWRFVVHAVLNLLGRLSEKVVKKYIKVVSLGGSFTGRYYADRGKRFYQLGMFHDAAFCYRKILEKNGADVSVLSALGRCYLKLGDSDRALGFLEKARKLEGFGGGWLDEDLIVAYIGTRQYDLALDRVQKSLEGDVPSSSVRRAALFFRLAEVLGHLSRLEEAVEAYKEAVALDPDRLEYSQALGFCLQMAGRSQEAAHYLRHLQKTGNKGELEDYSIALD